MTSHLRQPICQRFQNLTLVLTFYIQGDVQKKKTVIESHEDSQPKVPNGKVRTPTSSAVRKIVNEERAVSSPLGASGLARSPAMHSGLTSCPLIM